LPRAWLGRNCKIAHGNAGLRAAECRFYADGIQAQFPLKSEGGDILMNKARNNKGLKILPCMSTDAKAWSM